MPKAKEKPKVTTADVEAALATKFSLPQHAIIFQVPDGTGMNKCRTADALAINCWNSRQVELQGFEIKVSRGDWQKEMQDPSKSATFMIHCHRWWIVAAPGIVKLEELPGDWGLMELTARGNLSTKSVATLRNPEPLSFEMLAGIMRRAINCDPGQQALQDEYSRGWREGQAQVRSSGNVFEKELEKVLEQVTRFQNVTGLNPLLSDHAEESYARKFHAFKRWSSRVEREDLERQLRSLRRDVLGAIDDTENVIKQCFDEPRQTEESDAA